MKVEINPPCKPVFTLTLSLEEARVVDFLFQRSCTIPDALSKSNNNTCYFYTDVAVWERLQPTYKLMSNSDQAKDLKNLIDKFKNF